MKVIKEEFKQKYEDSCSFLFCMSVLILASASPDVSEDYFTRLAEIGRPMAGLCQLAPAEGLLASLAKQLASLTGQLALLRNYISSYLARVSVCGRFSSSYNGCLDQKTYVAKGVWSTQ